jgi:putative DNA primase/helicase
VTQGDAQVLGLRKRTTKKGETLELERHVANAISIFVRDPRWTDRIRFNDFAQAVEIEDPPWNADDRDAGPTTRRAWVDEDAVRAQAWLIREYQLSLGRETVRDAIAVVARRRVVHPVREWLSELRWDGQLRVDNWFEKYLGCPADAYTSRVGRWFLLGAIARIMRPGCKVDTMPVLEGQQGAGKSTALRTLFGEGWFTDTPLDLSSKDRFVGLQGTWCHEIAELDSFSRTDESRIKSFLSSPTDTFRPPYGRGVVTVPRQLVFAGTVNRDDYLRDETGNRRFFPVRCGRVDLEALGRDRDLIWAEAFAAFESGAVWWPVGDELAACAEEQAARVQQDPWQSIISHAVSIQTEVTVTQLLERHLNLEPGKIAQGDANRVAKILRLLGFRRVQRRTGAGRQWVYERPSA